MRSAGFLGIGGQGIVFAATVLGEALYRLGYYVAQLQNYGASVRGGAVYGYVVFGDKEIINPFIEELDILVVLHEQARRRWENIVEKSSTVIYDKDLVKGIPGGKPLPLASEADKNGVYKSLNMVALGVASRLLGVDGIDKAVDEVLGERKNYDTNIKAYRLGWRLAEDIRV